ncbi:MFS transporter [Bradyrhizobium sp. U87765 SZCCT0131]|uniref:MFS transporter n=1 Tax=unclassified Bradyrhizobium TaxID=2631580 RepID=UPI001BACABDF|nr:MULTISPECIES: MFS transporter [unclassified Bradyrhizobium]MBR1219506.1 MFS transporter [Bradyrhizobium sp. U87765 SZCCT0131]MBR1262157.1 MFS transporter [Bradyrhizobium sp. U87765 SZCCT0134]MBR1308660.1 MFS transporter [Bradyrhizobium sp. U87765 SZCCT0110]MBR1317939.1 MFS transporter [Bradyrhizobium sp. U87765 SZCCT0109]MBR1351642.1 MFS transporter [Bradyrhizobium sp. U87765 SZCCT0048]
MSSQTDEITVAATGSRSDAGAGDPRRWLALPVLLTGAFLPILDFNVVNLALPAIRQGLHASAGDLQFVISAYAATYAVFLITGGRLGDWLGRRPMFVTGVAGFTLASVLCGFAWSPQVLIVGRILQGLTATIMAPQVLASIRVLFPAAEQGRALAFYSATFGLANIVGQILGGVLVSSQPFGWTWQAIFLVNVPIGLVAFVGGLTVLGDSRAPQAQRLDLGGVVLLSLTLALLVYPLIEGRESGWPVWIVAMLIACPAMLAVFIAFERRLAARGGAPLVELSLFANGSFVLGVLMALALYLLASFYLTFAVYLQSGRQLTPLAAGVAMLPYAGGYFVASLASAVVMQRLRARTLTLGFALQVLGFGSVALTVAGFVAVPLSAGLACAGIGFGLVMPSVIKVVIGGVDPRHAGLASGIAISTFQIASALGVAVIGGVFYTVLGDGRDLAAYAHAFAVALGCNVVLLALGALLSLGLWDEA